AAHQHTQAGGVEEVDLGHVDDDVVLAGVDQISEFLTEPRSRVDVDLAGDLHHRAATLGPSGQRQIHHYLPPVCTCPCIEPRIAASSPSGATLPECLPRAAFSTCWCRRRAVPTGSPTSSASPPGPAGRSTGRTGSTPPSAAACATRASC